MRHISKKNWFFTIFLVFYFSEYEEYETVDEDIEEGEENIAPPPPPPPTQPESHAQEIEQISNEIPSVEKEKDETEYHHSSEVTNLIDKSHSKEDNTQTVTESSSVVVEPTHDPYAPRVLEETCGPDNGGCDQKCERVLYPGENEPRNKCSCSQGFSLDPYDYSTCHGNWRSSLFFFFKSSLKVDFLFLFSRY